MVPRRLTVAERVLWAGYVEGVAVLPAWQGRGLGRIAMSTLEQEQDCLMALRFGPSAALDLAADVVCQDRAGDVW